MATGLAHVLVLYLYLKVHGLFFCIYIFSRIMCDHDFLSQVNFY